MIISYMDEFAGFYSMLFFTANHYMYCKKNNIYFKLDTDKWLYKSKNGWTDYFKPLSIPVTSSEFLGEAKSPLIQRYGHSDLLGNFFIHEYRHVLLNNIYLYNDVIKEKIIETKKKLNLEEIGSYDSIFIRRGDKLIYESDYYSTENYVLLLLEKNPNCKTIFLQTDDYNCFLEIEKYIIEKNLDIKVITLCHPYLKGMVIFEKEIHCIEHAYNSDKPNNEYFKSISEELKKTKPVCNMNSEEKFQHTLELLIGIDIVLHSKYCILDNQSNVSRFISITHDNIKNVFDIRYPNENYDMNRTRSPAYN